MFQHSKECHDEVEELMAKIFVTKKEILCPDIFQEQQGMTSWLQQSFYVTTQDTYVMTITRQLQKNYVTTLSNYVATESKKKARNHVAKETVSHDKSWGTKMTTMSQQSNHLGKNFWGSIISASKYGHHLKIYK